MGKHCVIISRAAVHKRSTEQLLSKFQSSHFLEHSRTTASVVCVCE